MTNKTRLKSLGATRIEIERALESFGREVRIRFRTLGTQNTEFRIRHPELGNMNRNSLSLSDGT